MARSAQPAQPGRGEGSASGALRAIPADHEAERAVLGAILLDHDALYKIADRLRPASFDLPRHRILFDAYLGLADKQQACTLITLRAWLEEQGQLERVGGAAFLAEIAAAVPTAAHVEHHAELVRQRALARDLIRTCEGIALRGYDGTESPEELVAQAEAEVLRIAMGHVKSDFSLLKEELPATERFIASVQAGEIAGVASGYPDLDDKTGGFSGGELVVIAARPSMGKTALALDIARNHALEDNGCVALFSLEMTKRELVLRLLMGEAELDFGRFRRGVFTEQDMRALSRASQRLEAARIFIDDSGLLTMTDLAAKARRLHREQRLSMVIVDYIQLLQSRRELDRREQEVAEFSRSLKLLAKELGLPVLALSQLNRGPETRPDKRPKLSDLRESGAIEQDADVVIGIYRDEVYDEDSADSGVAEIILLKQRNGPTGTVKLQFSQHCGRFHSMARGGEPPPAFGFGPAGADEDDPPF
jgi:replicative DNA helicase